MKTNVYHIGIYKRKNTIVFQVVRCVDSLSCETIEYFGRRQKDKVDIIHDIRANKPALLTQLKAQYKTLADCKNITIE